MRDPYTDGVEGARIRGPGTTGRSGPLRGGDVRFDTLRERARSSLLVVPVMFLIAGVVAGEVLLRVDERLGDERTRMPLVLSSTVDGARAVLTTVATATLTVAGIAFSIALLVFQLASSQFSPRSIESLFRDPFNKRVIGLVVGTFAYCLMVLRAVRGPLDEEGSAVVPGLSVSVAVLLGLASPLGIVAFINHSAHSMKVSELLRRIADEAIAQAHDRRDAGHDGLDQVDRPPLRPDAGLVVRSSRSGWLQLVDERAVLAAVDDGASVWLETTPGRYVIAGTPLCRVWPPPPDAASAQRVASRIEAAMQLGRSRTMQQDPGYGLRQLVDIALVALSPGVNDPTTAVDAAFHLGSVLFATLGCPPPQGLRDERGAVLVPAEAPTHADLVRLAFDEVRRDAATRPSVCRALLEVLHHVAHSREWDRDSPEVQGELRRQAGLVVDGCVAAGPLPADLATVVLAHERRFGPA